MNFSTVSWQKNNLSTKNNLGSTKNRTANAVKAV